MRKIKYSTEEERKAAHREAQKRYYERHKNDKEYKDKKAEYRANHKAVRKAYYRKWWEEHKKEISAKNVDYRAEYRANHKAEKSAYMAEYYKKNKERRAEYMALYKSTPIGRAHNLVRNYRRLDRDKNRGKCTITPQWVVENVFSGQCCVYCGESDWHLLGCDRKDNALPHTPENCVPCCASCNCKKHTKSYNEFIGV